VKYLSIIFLAFFLLGATTKISSPSVPVGGTVAVFSNLEGAWQPPVSGAIKDGFMRADGAQVPASCTKCKIPAGTVLPDLTDKMLRGATTSGASVGSDSGSGSVTLVAEQIPQMTTSAITHQTVSGTFASTEHDHNFAHVHQALFFYDYSIEFSIRGLSSIDDRVGTWSNYSATWPGGESAFIPVVPYMVFNTLGSDSGIGSSTLSMNSTQQGQAYTGGALSPPSGNGGSDSKTSAPAGTESVSTSGGSSTLTVGSASPSLVNISVPTIPSSTTTIFVIRVY